MMVKYFYILLLLIITNKLHSQDYYPLQKSNLWNYSISNSFRKVSVLSDSLFPNGKHYAILNGQDIVGGKYVRADSQYVFYYDPIQNKEIPFFKLNGKVGDVTEVSFRNYLKVYITKIDSTIMFNSKVRLISYLIGSMTITEVTLSDKFGPTSASYYDDPPPPWPQFTYNLIGCVIDSKVFGNIVSVKQFEEIPNKIELYQNYPNPFNPVTKIIFQLPTESEVTLKVYDVLGKEVATLVNATKPAGSYEVIFNGSNIASGIYFYSMITKQNILTKKLVLIK